MIDHARFKVGHNLESCACQKSGELVLRVCIQILENRSRQDLASFPLFLTHFSPSLSSISQFDIIATNDPRVFRFQEFLLVLYHFKYHISNGVN